MLKTNPDRQKEGIAHIVQMTPFRLVGAMLSAAIMLRFVDLSSVILAASFFALLDCVVYALWRMIRRKGLTQVLALSAYGAHFAGILGYVLFLLFVQFSSTDPLAGVTAMIMLTVAFIDFASPHSRINPYAWVMTSPVLAGLLVSAGSVAHLLAENQTSLIVSLATLVCGAIYAVLVLVQNDRDVALLARASQRAELESKAKTRFLAEMSHEIRTPLHAVHGTAQLLEHERDPEAVQRLSRILIDAAGSLKTIVDDVIDYARAEAGKIDIRCDPSDPAQIAETAVALFRASADRRGLILRLSLARNLPQRVMLDRVRVGQILSNLISNALKFTESGEVSITVGHAGIGDPDGERLIFTVRDNGPGIAPPLQEIIFQPYETLGQQSAVKRSQTGAGLGLAISRRLARAMGGDITLVSAQGQGAAFTLHLPLVPCPEDARERPVAAMASASALKGMSVLVVDDVDINRIVVRAMLERSGAHVLEAANGVEGLEVLARDPVDVVLLDHMMPEMDGPEMLRRLRAQTGPQARTMVLGLSAGTLEEDRDAFMALGLDGFLSKPVEMAQLIGYVARGRAEEEPAQASARAG